MNDFNFEKELAKIEGKILDPKADIVFKAIFAQNTKESEMVRKDLLSSLLGQKVLTADLLRNELATMSEDEKSSRFDLFVRLDNKDEVNVEIQLKNVDDMRIRSEFYVCKMFAEQEAKGKKYADLHKSCQISILNFTIFPEKEKFIDDFMYRNADGDILSGNTKIIFVELGKILKLTKKPVENMTGAEKWSLFLKYANDERRKNLIERIENETEGIAMAAGMLDAVSQNRAMQLAYLSQYMHETDQISRTLHARDEGLAIGEKRGITIGEQRGRLEERIEMVANMLSAGMPVDQISAISKMSRKEISALKDSRRGGN